MNNTTNKKLMTSLVIVLLCIAMISGGYSTWLAITTRAPITLSGNIVELSVTEAQVTSVNASFVRYDNAPAFLLTAENSSAADDRLQVENKSTHQNPNQFTLQIGLQTNLKGSKTWAEWDGKDAGGNTVKFKVWFSDFAKKNASSVAVDADSNCLSGPAATDTSSNPTAWIELWKDGSTWQTAVYKDGAPVTGTQLPAGWGTPAFVDGVLTITMYASWGKAFNYQHPQTYINSKEVYTQADYTTDKANLDVLASIKNISISVNAQIVPES